MNTPPSPFRPDQRFWQLHQSASNLTQYACMVSARYIQDGVLRGQFNRDMAYYVRQVLEDVRNGRVRTEDGIKKIQWWYIDLQPYITSSENFIGLRAGAYQFFDGLKMCRSYAGCAVGLPIMAHGFNNVFENGSKQWNGTADAAGPVRHFYRYVAEELGYDAIEGDIFYGKVDIGMSLFSLFRRVPKKDAWKLFRRMPSDYERAYQASGKAALVLDAAGTKLTIDAVIEDMEK